MHQPSILAVITKVPQLLSSGLVAIYSGDTLTSHGYQEVSKEYVYFIFDIHYFYFHCDYKGPAVTISSWSVAIYSGGTLISHREEARAH